METLNRAQLNLRGGFWLMLATAVSLLLASPSGSLAANPIPIPELAQWESRMLTVGNQHCAVMNAGTGSFPEQLANTLYDAERVYYQISTYTSDPSWKLCANLAEATYRDGFVKSKGGNVPGDQVFTMGLKMDFLRTMDMNSALWLQSLVQNSQVTSGMIPETQTQSYEYSLQVALALMAYMDFSDASGEVLDPKFDVLLSQALDHIDQWYVGRLWEGAGAFPHSPLRVGMTLQALIQAQAHKPDPRIQPKIKLALDNLWTIAWRPNEQAFYPDSGNNTMGDPSFNLLIAPAYGWYYNQTGDPLYRERGDQIFAGGVKGASLAGAEQFNQNYMWSFDYVTWRQTAVEQEPPAPPPPPAPPSNTPPTCSEAKPRPDTLWPPNHKFVRVEIAGVTDPNNDSVALTVTGVKQDEPVNGKGDGHTRIDAILQGRTVALRAERARHGDGRVYELSFLAEDGKGGTCAGTVKVSVPVHKDEIAIDGGPVYDSLVKAPRDKKGHGHKKDIEKEKEMERFEKKIEKKLEKATKKAYKKERDRD